MDGFAADRLAKLADMERRHFWFAARRRLVTRLIERWIPEGTAGSPAADLGCGTGSIVAVLSAGGRRRALGLDGRPEGLAATRRSDPGAWLVRGDVTRLPLRDGSLRAALLLDVLEHVDDAAALAGLFRVLAAGGRVVVTVPALPSLWSHRDVAAGHLRRYTRSTLRGALETAGFRVLDLGFHHCALLPVLALTRRLGRRNARWRDAEDDVPGPLNAVFGAVCRAEGALGRVVRWPAGTSLWAVGERP